MADRIVVFGATGYTGGLIASRLVAAGARPVLAGRNSESLSALAERLGGLEWARADAMRQNTVFDLVSGPRRRADLHRRAVREVGRAGVARRGGRGLPLSGLDRRARAHPARLLGVRRARGALGRGAAAGDGLRLRSGLAGGGAGPGATRRRRCGWTSATTRWAAASSSLSSGTRESLVGITLGDGFAFRDGLGAPRADRRARALVHGGGEVTRGVLDRRRGALRAAGGVRRAARGQRVPGVVRAVVAGAAGGVVGR